MGARTLNLMLEGEWVYLGSRAKVTVDLRGVYYWTEVRGYWLDVPSAWQMVEVQKDHFILRWEGLRPEERWHRVR